MAALLLLQGLPSSASTPEFSTPRPDAVQLSYIKESEEMCRAMEPLELIKRVREITQEAYNIVQPKDTKQRAAEDLSQRLKDSHSFSDSASQKVQLNYFKESEETCRAMEPSELIKRVTEITQEAYVEAEIVQLKDTRQRAAEDLSKRLKDSRSFSDAAGQKVAPRNRTYEQPCR